MTIQVSKSRFRREWNSIIRKLQQGKYDVVKVTCNQELYRIVLRHDVYNEFKK